MEEALQQPTVSAPRFDLFTLGHSNHPIDRFMALLQGAAATAVVDVRSQPFSRRYPWFSANRLRDRLERDSISYLPMGDVLGGRPRDPALFRDGIADYEAMAGTVEFRAGLDRVVAETKRFRMCLMCAEREPLDCHRCLLLAPAFAARGLRLGHILGDGRIEPHADTEARLLAEGQSDADDLFEDPRVRIESAYRARMQGRLSRRNRLASSP